MKNSQRVLSLLRSICKFLLLLLLCFATLLTIASAVLKATLLDEQTYTAATEQSGFMEKMTVYVREELESECLFYGLPFSVANDALSNERIETFSREYLHRLYIALATGDALQEPEWQVQPFIDAVQLFFDSLPDEEKPLDKTAADTVGKELSNCALSMLKAGINETMLSTGHRVIAHPLFNAVTDRFWWLLGATILTALIGFLLAWRRWRYHLYSTAFALGIAAAAAFVPLWLIRRYDPASRLALMDSPLKLYVDTVINSIVDEALCITGWCFFTATVLVVISVVFQVLPRRSR